jgi:hypothetical protein
MGKVKKAKKESKENKAEVSLDLLIPSGLGSC